MWSVNRNNHSKGEVQSCNNHAPNIACQAQQKKTSLDFHASLLSCAIVCTFFYITRRILSTLISLLCTLLDLRRCKKLRRKNPTCNSLVIDIDSLDSGAIHPTATTTLTLIHFTLLIYHHNFLDPLPWNFPSITLGTLRIFLTHADIIWMDQLDYSGDRRSSRFEKEMTQIIFYAVKVSIMIDHD